MMDNQSFSTSSAESSAAVMWLENLNFDVIFSIVSWLDPLSILQLSCACKSFHAAIASEPLVWRRALNSVAAEYCIAPHSLDTEIPISDLKRFSTRPQRLIDAFLHSERPLSTTARKYVLDYSSAMPSSLAESRPVIELLPPNLLPGGRWILSGVIYEEKGMAQLFCWDRSQSHSKEESLHPVTSFLWEGLRPLTLRGYWVQAQLEGKTSLILACSLRPRGSGIVIDVLRLIWKDDSNVPAIELVARLDPHGQYIYNCAYADYHMHGDYVVVDTVQDILLWNWKEGLAGRFDTSNCEWADGAGFAVTALPPYLFIIPQERRETLVVEIPHLHPLGDPESFKLVRSPAIISSPFLDGTSGLSHMTLYHFDRWRPQSLWGGTVMVRSLPREDIPSLFHLISLESNDGLPPIPSRITQITAVPPKLDTPEADTVTMVEGVGLLFLNWPVHYEPYDERLYEVEPERGILYTSFHPITEDGNIGNVVDREIELTYPCKGTPAQLDLISGAVVVKGQNAGDEPSTHIIGIISFD